MKKWSIAAAGTLLAAAGAAFLAMGCDAADTGVAGFGGADLGEKPALVSQETNRGDVIDIPWKASEPLKFSMSFSDAAWYAYKKEWKVFDKIKAATNVEMDLMVIPSTDYNNKRSLLISTGDQPLIMPKTYPGSEIPFIPSGQILAISDYIDYLPNFKASVQKWHLEGDLKTITQRDGKFYVLPGLHETFAQDYSMAVRTDILRKHDIPVPDSWDDIEKMLKKLKELYPDMYPYSETWQLGMTLNIAGPAFGLGSTGLKTAQVNWNNNVATFYDEKADTFSFYPTMPQYRDMLRYFARLVKEGLMDPESASQTDDQANNKFINGQSFLIGCSAQKVNEFRTKMKDALGEGNFEVTRINVPSGPAGGRIVGTRLENGIMISAKAAQDPHFKDLLRFVDWVWYSYSGQELTKWGVEGETFKFDPATGAYSLMPGFKLPAYGIGGSDTDLDLRIEQGYAGGNLILSYGGPRQLQVSLMSQENRDFTDTVNKTRTIVKPAPVIPYDEDQLESQNMIQQPLMDYVFQMTYKFILGQSDIDKDWDAFVDQCRQKGADRFIETANKVYKGEQS